MDTWREDYHLTVDGDYGVALAAYQRMGTRVGAASVERRASELRTGRSSAGVAT
jgi:hypothetical protein